MSNDDMDFVSGTAAARSISNLCFVGAVIFLISHEVGITDSLLDWTPSIAVPIVLALLGVGLRLIAIDRLLRMARQKDHEARRVDYGE
ncbi:hypothetical protein [Alcanivorax sp. 1008]|uniref:hypothetical protein n=1 Tax=Alcanivorax sp. 1008 TaxID=2816853 RepID=UPI001D41B898|nr:hypothetical protein [Alcanivorax sp. 1008]MCC1498078.1 hypothetical protein [Alcanivorax sp. 1008]